MPNIENPLLNGDYSINENHARFHFQTIHPDELSKIMNKFKTSQSFGIDGISCSFLKIAMPVLAPSLCSIFNIPVKILKMTSALCFNEVAEIANAMLESGLFPNKLKKADVSPIFKNVGEDTVKKVFDQ